MKDQNVGVRVPVRDLKQIDELVVDGKYLNRRAS